jgi:prepilin-type N-terminal cleavage/methylation domain-containing protein
MASNNEKGFTLIEIIISIVLMTIVATVVGMGFLRVVEGYVYARTNAEIVEKGQVAITRMIKELSNNCAIKATSTATSIKFTRPGSAVQHDFTWTNGTTVLLLDGETLTDRVNNFALESYGNSGAVVAWGPTTTKQVQITLQLTAVSNVEQTVTVTNRVYIGGL